jgi:hypothetical protein
LHHHRSTTTQNHLKDDDDDDDDNINNRIDLEYDSNNIDSLKSNNTINDNKLIEINRKHHYRHGKHNKTLSDDYQSNSYFLKNKEQYPIDSYGKHLRLF